MYKTALPLLLLLLASSCTGDTMWHQYVHVDSNGWHGNDTLSFCLPATLAEGTYSMNIELRTTPAFPYQRLCVVRRVLLSHPADTCRDTVSIQTSTNGQCLTGDGVTVQSFAQPAPDIRLLQGQQAHVQLYHIMSRGTMPDIMDVGIRVKAHR